MTTLVQVDLRADNQRLTCWVKPPVRVGDRITLKDHADPTRLWDVLRVGTARDAGDVKRGWHNDLLRGWRDQP